MKVSVALVVAALAFSSGFAVAQDDGDSDTYVPDDSGSDEGSAPEEDSSADEGDL